MTPPREIALIWRKAEQGNSSTYVELPTYNSRLSAPAIPVFRVGNGGTDKFFEL
jgi:hypothetical protein